jgi:hypothetical protein
MESCAYFIETLLRFFITHDLATHFFRSVPRQQVSKLQV